MVSELIGALVAELTESGALRSRAWQKAFESVPRHVFVPSFYRGGPFGREIVEGARPENRDDWLASVYSDTSLPVRYDSGMAAVATSASTMPSLMAIMLEALEVSDGLDILEIGTGTGYNTAILCARLGQGHVTSIDVEPELVESARARLATLGYHPTVAAANGVDGYPAKAPYDRILSTCSVPRVPKSWIEQTQLGGFIVTHLPGGQGGGLARLRVSHGLAEGRFQPAPSYSPLIRGAGENSPSLLVLLATTIREGEAQPTMLPSGLGEDSFWFLAQLAVPGIVHFGHGPAGLRRAPRLVDPGDGSWARVDDREDGVPIVTQGGPRRLWDELIAAHALWLELGRPARHRYGITVTPEGDQFAWLDNPLGQHAWDLPP